MAHISVVVFFFKFSDQELIGVRFAVLLPVLVTEMIEVAPAVLAPLSADFRLVGYFSLLFRQNH